MNSSKNTLVVVTLVVVLLCLGASLTSLVLRVVYGHTGIKLSYFHPGCNRPYFNIKFGYTYLSLLAQFIALGVSSLCSIIAAIVLIIPLAKSSQAATGQQPHPSSEKQQQTLKYQVLYVTCSFGLLGQIIAGGGALNFILQGANCTNISQYIKAIVNYCSLGGLCFGLLGLILVFMLIYQRNPPPGSINMNELKGNAKNGSDDEDLNKQLQDEAKDYLGYMSRQRQQAQQGLLGYQQSIYSPNYHQNSSEFQNNIFKKASGSEQESEYTYYYQQVLEDETNMEPQKANNKENNVESIGGSLEGNSPSLKTSSPRKQLNSAVINSQQQNGQVIQKASSHIVEDETCQIKEQLGGMERYRELPEEVKKILLTTLFRNRPGSSIAETDGQRECPILKYLERDQREEVTQNNDFKIKGNNKKKLYERQKLFFHKKRKQVRPQEDFDEEEQIKKDRLQRFGEEWVKKREEEEAAIRKEISKRFQKRTGLETIRSKYYH